ASMSWRSYPLGDSRRIDRRGYDLHDMDAGWCKLSAQGLHETPNTGLGSGIQGCASGGRPPETGPDHNDVWILRRAQKRQKPVHCQHGRGEVELDLTADVGFLNWRFGEIRLVQASDIGDKQIQTSIRSTDRRRHVGERLRFGDVANIATGSR